MYAFTEPTEILFVTSHGGSSDPPDAVDAIDSDGRSVSCVTWTECRKSLRQELPDCILLSESLGAAKLVEHTRTLQRTTPTVPVVAFVGDTEPVEQLFDAGVTDVIRAPATAASASLVERRVEAARALAGRAPTSEQPGTTPDDEPADLLWEVTENINDIVWVNSLDEDGLTYVNSAYEEVCGRSREPLYKDRSAFLETIHPEDRECVREAMDHQLAEPEAYDMTYRVVRPDGDQRWIHSRAVGVRENGALERIVGVATDITERKGHQQQLAAERDLIERIFETSPVGIVVIDTSGIIARANEQAGEILGMSKSTLEGELYSPTDIRIHDMDGEELPDEAFPFNRIKSTGKPLCDKQYLIEQPDGEETVISVDGVPLFDDGSLERVVITFDDVTEQVERERKLEEQRDELSLLNHINRVIRGVDQALLDAETREQVFEAACDELAASDRYQFAVALRVVGEHHLEATAFTEGAAGFVDEVYPLEFDSLSESTSGRALETNETQVVPRINDSDRVGETLAAAFQDAGVQSLAVVPVQYGDVQYGTVAVYSPREDAFGRQERAVFDELGETVGHAIAAVESRQRERTLTSLYEATEGFLAAETQQEVSDVAVDAALEVLDLSGIGIFLFDDETNLLAPVAGTDTLLEEFCVESQAFGPGKEDSITWHTYVTGAARCFADVRESDRLASPDTSARAALFIPLGEHGVFVAASRETGAFTEQKRQLVGLLTATTEAALDRVAGQADIRERDAALEKRSQQLDRLEQLLSASQEITALIRDVKMRTELEQQLCEQLVEYECLSFAWVGHRPADSDEVEPRTWAGSEDGYLDAISLQPGEEPALETTLTGETTRVANVTTRLREEPWARKAINRGYQSVLAIPLAYGDTDYGVLAVYSTEPGAFSGVVEEVAGDLGSTVAYGINNVETRRGILGERATELDIHLGETETLLNAVAATVGEPVSYREMAPLDEHSTQILFQLTDPPVEEILALEAEFVAVESLTHTQREGTHIFRATVSGESVATELLDCGGIPEEVTATTTETRATVRLSTELNVREFLDRLKEHYPAAELRSRHDAERVDETVADIRHALGEELTDRQREVLVTAYESGYFQSPRETTGEELAELLGISQPTVTHHLREAQHRLFTALLDDA